MTPDELYTDFVRAFPGRKFTAGLLIAFIDFFDSLETHKLGFSNFGEFLVRFVRRERTAAGAR